MGFFLPFVLSAWCALSYGALARPSLTIAVDLDKTLYHKLRTLDELEKAERLFPERIMTTSGGEFYVAYPGAAEFLEQMVDLLDAEVIVWSAGPEARTRELISKLRPPSGRDLVAHLDGVWGFEDLSDAAFEALPPQSEDERAIRQRDAYLNHASFKDPRFARVPRDIRNFLLVDDYASYMPERYRSQHIEVDWSEWTFECMLGAGDGGRDSPLAQAHRLIVLTLALYQESTEVSVAPSIDKARELIARCEHHLDPQPGSSPQKN